MSPNNKKGTVTVAPIAVEKKKGTPTCDFDQRYSVRFYSLKWNVFQLSY